MPKTAEKPKKKYKYYKGSFTVGKKADGSPERVYVRGKTKAERDENLAEAKRLHARGLKAGETTVREWGQRWLAVNKANASEKQYAHYKNKLNADILPVIGNMRMKDVRKSHLQELLNSYSGGKTGTVEKVKMAIRQLFDDAEDEGLIERSPARKLEMPETEESPRRPLTVTERKAVIKVAEEHKRGPFFLTMMYCGVRRGECLALVCGDADLKKKRLSITKGLYMPSNVGTVTGTKASKLRKKKRGDEEIGPRTVPIPDILMPVMEKLCEGKAPGDLMFPKADGNLGTHSAYVRWWKSFVWQCHIAAGAPLYRNAIVYEKSPFDKDVTPHYLRHTYATDLHGAGIDLMTRRTFLGHASNDVTDTYTAMSDEAFDRAAEMLNEYYREEKWDKTEPQGETAAEPHPEYVCPF